MALSCSHDNCAAIVAQVAALTMRIIGAAEYSEELAFYSRAGANFSMDWDKLRIFHAAAAAGSFTHAGDNLHMSQSAVSRQVSALEKDLKVSLFHRHARGLVLTEQGDLLFNTVSDVIAKLQTAEMLLTDTTTKPSGYIRISAPVGLGSVWMTKRIREFIDLYPEIRVELMLDDEQIDIAMRAGDVAIWTREPDQPDLIRRPLFNAKVRALASAQYIRRFGLPETLADLDNGHRIISYSGQPSQHLPAISWLETAGRDGASIIKGLNRRFTPRR